MIDWQIQRMAFGDLCGTSVRSMVYCTTVRTYCTASKKSGASKLPAVGAWLVPSCLPPNSAVCIEKYQQ